MDLLIRAVQPDDANDIVRIINPIIEAGKYTVLDETLTVEDELAYISNFPERGVFHIAEQRSDGQIVGFQSLEPFAEYTHAFDHVAGIGTFVDLALQRKGIGIRLSGATFEAGRQKGYEKLFTYIRADNPGSLAFHQKLGFRVIGTARRHAIVGGKYVDEILIEAFL